MSLYKQAKHCKQILKKLYLIRQIEETIAERYSEGKMRCPTHLSIGQEAVPATLSVLLSHEDLAVSTHRSHAHYLGKGGCPKAMIAELYGKASGCSGGRGGSMHLYDDSVGFKGSTAIVGNTIPIGVGLALAMKMRKEKNISVVFVGDGAIEEGVFYESLNFAAVQKLPVLFVCENNLYSVYSNLSVRQPVGRKIHELAGAIGAKTNQADGNDVSDLYPKLKDAIDYLRNGSGPYFIECSTYRWREHCGPNYDDDLNYRPKEEVELWKQKEPIKRFEDWLNSHQILTEDMFGELKKHASSVVNQAFDFAESSPFPDTASIARHVYHEDSP